MQHSSLERRARTGSSKRPVILTGGLVLAIGMFMFYWFQLRPIAVYRLCATQASSNAHDLLTNKAELAKGTPEGAQYDSLLQKGMYLRSDYNSFLQKCLLYYGRPMPVMASDSSSSQ